MFPLECIISLNATSFEKHVCVFIEFILINEFIILTPSGKMIVLCTQVPCSSCRVNLVWMIVGLHMWSLERGMSFLGHWNSSFFFLVFSVPWVELSRYFVIIQ